MSPRPELSKPMTSVTAAASTSRKLTRTTTSPSHWSNAERGNPMRKERPADESAPSTLTALTETELPAFRFLLIVEAGSLGYSRSGLPVQPPERPWGVVPGPQRGVIVEGATQLGEEGVVVDLLRRVRLDPR